MNWIGRLSALAGAAAVALATGTSAEAATAGDTTLTIPMTWLPAGTATAHPDGTSGRVPGTCGFAKFDTRASTKQFDLTLWSTVGALGAGSYTVSTDGIGMAEQPGIVNANGRSLWSSQWQILLDPGLNPSTARLTGFVFGGGGVCGFSLTAPWT